MDQTTPKPVPLLLPILLIITSFNVFIYGTEPLLGLALHNIVLVTAILFWLPKNRLKNPGVWLVALTSIFLGLFLAIRANEFLYDLNKTYMFISMFMLLFTGAYEKVILSFQWFVKSLFFYIVKAPLFLLKPFKFNIGKSQDLSVTNAVLTVAQLTKTIVIAFFVLGFFTVILVVGDTAFAHFVKEVLNQSLLRILLSLLLAYLFAFLFSMKHSLDEEKVWKMGLISYHDLIVSGVGLVILFGSFLAIQFKYLFGSHEHIQQFGITYSEYVRDGFIELLIAAFFASLFVYISIVKSRILENIKRKEYLQVVNGLLVVELAFMLYSAFERNSIYIETYGLTRVRVVGIVFLASTALYLLLLLGFNLVKHFKESIFLTAAYFVFFLSVFVLNVINIDSHIAGYNKKLTSNIVARDVFYTSILSTDASMHWLDTVDYALNEYEAIYIKKSYSDFKRYSDDEVARLADIGLAMITLQRHSDYLVNKYAPTTESKKGAVNSLTNKKILDKYNDMRTWQAYNKSEIDAYNIVVANKDLFLSETGIVQCLIANTRFNKTSTYQRSRLRTFEYPLVELDSRIAPENLEQLPNNMYFTPIPCKNAE